MIKQQLLAIIENPEFAGSEVQLVASAALGQIEGMEASLQRQREFQIELQDNVIPNKDSQIHQLNQELHDARQYIQALEKDLEYAEEELTR